MEENTQNEKKEYKIVISERRKILESKILRFIIRVFGSGIPVSIISIINLIVSGKIAAPILSAITLNIVFNRIIIYWDKVPLLFASHSSRLVCSLSVIMLGFLFYMLREKYRFIYASLELGVGAATAYNAVAKLFHSHDNNAALLTLLGSIYISVRAFDNYAKFYKEDKKNYHSYK